MRTARSAVSGATEDTRAETGGCTPSYSPEVAITTVADVPE